MRGLLQPCLIDFYQNLGIAFRGLPSFESPLPSHSFSNHISSLSKETPFIPSVWPIS